jgi:hypothetical protein
MATAWVGLMVSSYPSVILIMRINGCATGNHLHKYIVEMEWLQSAGTGFLMRLLMVAISLQVLLPKMFVKLA